MIRARVPVAAFLALVLLAACSPGPTTDSRGPAAQGRKARAEAPPEARRPTGASPAAADKTPDDMAGFLSEENQRVILLFYPAEDGETLVPEERVIFLTNTLGSQVKQAVSELLRGPEQEGPIIALPRSTRLLAVFILDDGTAMIDLGSEARAIPSGSSGELAAIYSLVNTVIFNFKEIERVQILIEGQEVATLAGHVFTGGPLRADLTRIDWTWMPGGEDLPWDPPAVDPATGAAPASVPDPV